jgi:hypothetical protein
MLAPHERDTYFISFTIKTSLSKKHDNLQALGRIDRGAGESMWDLSISNKNYIY